MIRHALRVVHNAIREAAKRHPIVAHLIGKKPRSPLWPAVERKFRSMNDTCAACKGTARLNVHHMQPFHLHPELELEVSNLITLCMGSLECHIRIGHGDDFKAYNPNVTRDAWDALHHPAQRHDIEARAKAARLYEG